jgi:hypothetical protein
MRIPIEKIRFLRRWRWFFNGNEFFSISQNDELKKDDTIEVSHFGISKAYYNYMSILSIAGNSGGGPFNLARS